MAIDWITPASGHAITGVGENAAGPLFPRRRILTITTVALAVALAAIGLARTVRSLAGQWGWQVDCPRNWPLSMFSLKIPGIHAPAAQWCVALAVLAVFFILVRSYLHRLTSSLPMLVALGALLVLGTNLIHGPQYGLANPHAGEHQYYHDAAQVSSAGDFLRQFNATQPQLGCHARTHPPGAVLAIYGLTEVFDSKAGVSIAIALLAVGLAGTFFFGILAYDFDRHTCGYVTLLFLLVPSMQIYCCATLDALIAGCFLGVLFFIRHPHPVVSVAGGVVGLFCASMLTFGTCFLGPVLFGVEIVTRRSVRRSAAITAAVGLLYASIYWLTGFDYLQAFRLASALENPQGFMLFAEPASYVITRFEDVADIVWYFGPFLLVLFAGGLRVMWRTGAYPGALATAGLGLFTLAAMFLSGAFRTGETARACLFIVPYLMLPVAAYLHHRGSTDQDKRVLAWLVFGQSLAMQTFGGYYW